jgi:hypothetical protein
MEHFEKNQKKGQEQFLTKLLNKTNLFGSRGAKTVGNAMRSFLGDPDMSNATIKLSRSGLAARKAYSNMLGLGGASGGAVMWNHMPTRWGYSLEVIQIQGAVFTKLKP